MARLVIPTPLRKFTSGEKNFETQATTVDGALSQLVETYPDLKGHLFNEDDSLRSFIKVFVGDDDIKDLNKGETALAEQTVVSIVPAIAGGKR